MEVRAKQIVPEVKISDSEFEIFRDYFYRKTGIFFEDNKRYFVDKRLIERMAATQSGSFKTYYTMLRFETLGEEFQHLVNRLTVNETYFFREEYQFQCLVQSVLNEVMAEKAEGEAIRIWSIPCSTGEEPYSIAIYILEHWPKIHNVDVEIVASDINTLALSRCQRGIYNERSVQNLPKQLLEKYFSAFHNDKFLISEDLRTSVEFCRVNLLEPPVPKLFRAFDVIFCRNMLIYFDDASRRIGMDTLYDALNPGGFIFLGHSESMSRISSLFKIRSFSKTVVYQKPIKGGV